MSKAKISPFSEITGPQPETLSSVMDVLEVTKPKLRIVLGGYLHAIAYSFELTRVWQQVSATDHQAIDDLRQLTELLDKTESSMQALRPDVQLMIRNLEDPPYSNDDWNGLVDGLKKLSGILAKSKTAKLKRRQGDVAFDIGVAYLMLRIKEATGKLAHARPADSRYSRPARLASKEAEAIWMLLKHIEGMTESNVANRIIKLKRRHKDGLKEAYPDYIFIGGKMRFHTAED